MVNTFSIGYLCLTFALLRVRRAIEAASSCVVWTSGSMLRCRTTCNCYLRRVLTLSSVGRTRSVSKTNRITLDCSDISYLGPSTNYEYESITS